MSKPSPVSILLPIGSIEKMLLASRPSVSYAPETKEGLRLWLEGGLRRAIRRAEAKPLIRPDVERLEKAYLQFRNIVEELQDRDDPPPLTQPPRCLTRWQDRMSVQQHFGFKRGPKEVRDWRLIAEILALYEVTSEARSSGSAETNPTMRFLEVALGELVVLVPPDFSDRFSLPFSESLKYQLAHMREWDLPSAKSEILTIILSTSGR